MKDSNSKDTEYFRKPRRAYSLSVGDEGPVPGSSERMKHTRDFKAKGFKANSRGTFIQAPFTTLEEMFKKLPQHIGFNIEMSEFIACVSTHIKLWCTNRHTEYPMLHESEEQDMDTYAVELNSFVDTVLTKVYDLGKKRNILFSSFNPDICLLLSFKQPSIPVMFLTDAGTCPVSDIRASSLQEAIRFASRWNLLGVVSEAQPLVMCPRLVKVVKESGLVCVSYGVLNNDPKNVKVRASATPSVLTSYKSSHADPYVSYKSKKASTLSSWIAFLPSVRGSQAKAMPSPYPLPLHLPQAATPRRIIASPRSLRQSTTSLCTPTALLVTLETPPQISRPHEFHELRDYKDSVTLALSNEWFEL